MLGVGSTVKFTPLLATPLAFTTTFPVVAELGTAATTLVALQLSGVTDVPLKLKDPLPCVTPKLVPAIVTETPTAPEVGDRLVMLGAGTTVKFTPLLA
jgi:Na+-transporting methylmalonyl-CoA/oxaloacetate decarboxylase beta subunit